MCVQVTNEQAEKGKFSYGSRYYPAWGPKVKRRVTMRTENEVNGNQIACKHHQKRPCHGLCVGCAEDPEQAESGLEYQGKGQGKHQIISGIRRYA